MRKGLVITIVVLAGLAALVFVLATTPLGHRLASGALESAVEDARAVVGEAQQWAQENVDVVCRGGSISLGTTVGVAVFALTGVEWLGLQAFWATERFSNGICGDFVE